MRRKIARKIKCLITHCYLFNHSYRIVKILAAMANSDYKINQIILQHDVKDKDQVAVPHRMIVEISTAAGVKNDFAGLLAIVMSLTRDDVSPIIRAQKFERLGDQRRTAAGIAHGFLAGVRGD